jgi:hypothetical protein
MNLPRIKSGFSLLLRSSTMFFTSFPNWNLMGIRARQVGVCLRAIRSGLVDEPPVKNPDEG